MNEWLSRKAIAFWPGDISPIVLACTLGGSLPHPLGFSHTTMLLSLIDSPSDCEDAAIDNLTAAYVFGCAYFFLLDSIVDGHASGGGACISLTPLSLGVAYYIYQAFSGQCSATQDRAMRLVGGCLFSCTESLINEREMQIHTDVSEEAERACDIGRSGLFLMQYQLLCLLLSKPENNNAFALCERYIHMRQRIDDLGDWREDFRGNRTTPFLRAVLRSIDSTRDESQLEEHVYLQGAYESELEQCITQARLLLCELGVIRPYPVIFIRDVEYILGALVHQHHQWTQVKLRHWQSMTR